MFIDKDSIEIGKFKASAKLIYQDNIYHDFQTKENIKKYFLIQKAQNLNVFFAKYEKVESFFILLLSIEWDYLGFNQKPDQDLILNHTIVKDFQYICYENKDVLSALKEYTKEKKIQLYLSSLEIYQNEQESHFEEEVFMLGSYFSAGNPPLVLIKNQKFHFPVRSGIPLNITDFSLNKQKIEIPLHSKVYIHSLLNEKIHDIKQLHYNFLNNNLFIQLPKNILVFELYLNEYS